jgi:hypothetical protein
MQTDAPVRRTGGRLSREDQRRLGDILQRVYDDVIQQGVPDRFRSLVNQLDGSDKGDTHAVVDPSPRRRQDFGEQDPSEEDAVSDRVVGTRGLNNPGSKDSH